MKSRTSQLLALGTTALVTAALTTFARNFISGERKIRHRIKQRYGVSDPLFERSMSLLMGPPILDGNLITPLRNGVEIFPAMLEAIAQAERSITFETFIYTRGATTQRFADALSAKAREGVKVHVLVDGVGCNCVTGQELRQMRAAGAEVEVYHLSNFARANHRTHRKILVVDGKLGFTGGVGIGDLWEGNARSPSEWRDSHYRVEGPVVAQMQAAFLDNWMKTRAIVLHGEEYFPALEPVGPHRCQMFKSSPMEGSESARLMYLLSIAAAERTIKVGNAYFVPDDLTQQTLVDALDRGVSIEVLLPGDYTDAPVVRAASRHRWGTLLERGLRLYEFLPTMYHCKLMIIDNLWTSVGSANFDNRSFRLNDEANLNVLDRDIAAGESKAFDHDLTRAREVTYQEWMDRPTWRKATDGAAALVRSQL